MRRGAPRPPHYCSAATPTTGPEPLCGGTFGNHRKVQREHKTHPDPTSGQQPCSLSVLSHQSETNSSQRSQKTEKQDLSASPPVPCSCPPAARPPASPPLSSRSGRLRLRAPARDAPRPAAASSCLCLSPRRRARLGFVGLPRDEVQRRCRVSPGPRVSGDVNLTIC